MVSPRARTPDAFPTVEQEIGQTRPFRSDRHRVLVTLLLTANRVRELLRARAEPYGITMTQYNVLRILRGARKPLSTSRIRERMLDRTPDASRLVDRLVQKGYVDRCPCAKDRRLVDVVLTDAGRDLLRKMDRRVVEIPEIGEHLDEADARRLADLLDRLRAGIPELA